jgi:hypothetical protein
MTTNDTKAIRLASGRIVVEHPIACEEPNVTIAQVDTLDGCDLGSDEWEEYCQYVVESKRRPPVHALYR